MSELHLIVDRLSERCPARPRGFVPWRLSDAGRVDVARFRRLVPGADIARTFRLVRDGPILLQKSPQRFCEIKIGNNRIRAAEYLNQCFASVPSLNQSCAVRWAKSCNNIGHHRTLAGPRIAFEIGRRRTATIGPYKDDGTK